MKIRTFDVLFFLIPSLFMSYNYALGGKTPEESFYQEMAKLPNFKREIINNKIVYNFELGQKHQSVQLNFKDGILLDGFLFSSNIVPPNNAFNNIAIPLFAAMGFNQSNTNELRKFTSQINKRRKHNDNIKVGAYIITVQTGQHKGGTFYNFKFHKI